MEPRSLYELIKHVERGTRLHIGVLFFGNYGNDSCRLPHDHTIHASAICENFKKGYLDYRRCFRCRNMALSKAIEKKEPFGGLCSNGIYEYTHPVVIENEVAAVIFVGNVLPSGEINERLAKRIGDRLDLINTVEKNISPKELSSLGKIIEDYILFLFEKGGSRLDSGDALVENVKSYIRSNIEFNVTTSQVASVFHYNKSYLGRRFKAEAGMSIAEYLHAKRLAAAKEYLLKTTLNVLEISERCGYSEVSYFNRLFKSATGKTPSEYRKTEKKK